MEKKDNNMWFWFFEMISGIINKYILIKIYNLKLDVFEVIFEFYYEKGIGFVIFDNILMKVKGFKDVEYL